MAGKESYIYNENNQLIYPKTVASAIDLLDEKINDKMADMHFVTNNALVSTLTAYFPDESGRALTATVGTLISNVASLAEATASIQNTYVTTTALEASITNVNSNLTTSYQAYVDTQTTAIATTLSTNYYTVAQTESRISDIVTGNASIDLSNYVTTEAISNTLSSYVLVNTFTSQTAVINNTISGLADSISGCLTTSDLTDTLSAYYTSSQADYRFVQSASLDGILDAYATIDTLPTYATCADV